VQEATFSCGIREPEVRSMMSSKNGNERLQQMVTLFRKVDLLPNLVYEFGMLQNPLLHKCVAAHGRLLRFESLRRLRPTMRLRDVFVVASLARAAVGKKTAASDAEQKHFIICFFYEVNSVSLAPVF
jgi:hypothetical protein